MLVFVGLSHQQAPLRLRERCAVPVHERERAEAELRQRLGRVVLLSTCGRVELYIDHPNTPTAEREALDWLATRAGLEPCELRPYIESAHGVDVAQRVIRVACGLESALQGEDEILGQVRRAWLDASVAGALSPAIDAAFRLAVRTGRQVRRIGDRDSWTSLADTAVARVTPAIEGLATPRVLVMGTGPMGLRAARSLRGRFGADLELALAGRTRARVEAHAAELGAQPLELAAIAEALGRADAAVIGLRTSRPLIGPDSVPPRAPERPLLLVDLSVPRAVDGTVARMPGVRVLDVDQLAPGDAGCIRWDAAARARVEELAARALQDYVACTEQSDATATLAALRLQAEAIRQRQLTQTLRRLPHLDDEARWAIDALTRAIVNRVLHEPTMQLRADADGSTAEHVRALFGMERTAEPSVDNPTGDPRGPCVADRVQGDPPGRPVGGAAGGEPNDPGGWG